MFSLQGKQYINTVHVYFGRRFKALRLIPSRCKHGYALTAIVGSGHTEQHTYERRQLVLYMLYFVGMLECADGTLLKPLPSGRCGQSELTFYETVWHTKWPLETAGRTQDAGNPPHREFHLSTSSETHIPFVDGDGYRNDKAILVQARKFVPTYLGTYVDPKHPEGKYLRQDYEHVQCGSRSCMCIDYIVIYYIAIFVRSEWSIAI